MLQDGWNIIKSAASDYFSGGYFWSMLLVAVIFCLCVKGKKAAFFGWYIVFYSILALNPISAVVLSKLGLNDVYWRAFWMLPVSGVIAYVFTKLIGLVNIKIIRGILTIGSVILVVVSGKLIYTSKNFHVAENAYKIPEEVIEVSECLEKGNAVLAPADIMVWLRTYNADLYLPIGRQSYYFGGNIEQNMLVDSLSNPDITDVGYIASGALQYGCKYIVLEDNRQMVGDWEAYGYYLADQTDDFLIYEKE